MASKEKLKLSGLKLSNNQKSRQETATNADELIGMTDSLDFDNSDDLNKIISKYESMLGGSNNTKPQGSNTPLPQANAGSDTKQKASQQVTRKSRGFEESWGSHERLSQEISSAKKELSNHPQAAIEENYDEDDFEKTDDFEEEEDKIYKKEHGFEDEDDDKLVDEEFNLNSS